MLIASNLPSTFYAEAQLTAAYLFNLFVHGQETKTPYEYIYGRKPNLSHLRSFGTICYAHIPSERRTKVAQSAEKCRLIGHSDDDDTEEFRGYKLIRESDLAIVYAYTSDVIFDELRPMTPLDNYTSYDDDSHGDDIFGDLTYENDSPNDLIVAIDEKDNSVEDLDVINNPFKKGPLNSKRRPVTRRILALRGG